MGRGMGSDRAVGPRTPRLGSTSAWLASGSRAPSAPRAASERPGPRAQPGPTGPSPGSHKGSPSPALPGRCTISGSPPPFSVAEPRGNKGARAAWGQRGPGRGRGRGVSPVGRALFPDHLLVSRQQLQAVAAEADAGHAAGRTEAERTDARTDRPTDTGGRG